MYQLFSLSDKKMFSKLNYCWGFRVSPWVAEDVIVFFLGILFWWLHKENTVSQKRETWKLSWCSLRKYYFNLWQYDGCTQRKLRDLATFTAELEWIPEVLFGCLVSEQVACIRFCGCTCNPWNPFLFYGSTVLLGNGKQWWNISTFYYLNLSGFKNITSCNLCISKIFFEDHHGY